MLQEFVKSVKDTAKQAVDGIHTAMPAEVVSFDASSGMATVLPKAVFRLPNGKTIRYPQISGVPVVFPRSGDAVIAFPIKEGDGCLLIFSETALDLWLYGKETDTNLKFDLTNAIAIPSLSTTGSDAMRRACEENAVVIKAGETVLSISPDGVTVTGNLAVSGEITSASSGNGEGE